MRKLLVWTMMIAMPAVALAENPIAVRVFPGDIHLTTVRDRQSLIVQAEYANGLTQDVTADAKYSLADAALARL